MSGISDARTATFSSVLADREFRALFSMEVLSLIGDMLARVAVGILVWQRTGSTLLAAASFALSYLPWVLGGPVLAAVADRSRWRRTMVSCDVIRGVLIGALALPGAPIWVLLLVLFLSSMLEPPFQASRSAMLPTVLSGDAYPVGLSLQNAASQGAQVVGFLLGGVLAAVDPQLALAIDAVTFLGSAVYLRLALQDRPAPAAGRHNSLLTDTKQGFVMVFRHPQLRIYITVAWVGSVILFASEGLAAPYGTALGGGAKLTGALLAATTLGMGLGATLLARLVSHERREGLVMPLLLVSGLLLLPLALQPPVWAVLMLLGLAGFCSGSQIVLNSLFMRSVPLAFRGRAFGVAQGGLQIAQGVAVLVAGIIAEWLAPGPTLALFGLIGIIVLGVMTTIYPTASKRQQALVAEPSSSEPAAEPSSSEPAAEPASEPVAVTRRRTRPR